MGWTNFIIIHGMKLAIEISRCVDDIEDYEQEALNYLTEDKEIVDVDDTMFSSLTLKELASLILASDKIKDINAFYSDKFLLYWLKSRNILYEIKSNYNTDLKNLEETGYVIKRL